MDNIKRQGLIVLMKERKKDKMREEIAKIKENSMKEIKQCQEEKQLNELRVK